MRLIFQILTNIEHRFFHVQSNLPNTFIFLIQSDKIGQGQLQFVESCQHYNNFFPSKMSKITPFLQEVVYLVADLLASLDHNKQAQKLKKEFELPEWLKKDNPLIKKGLKKILKDYINSNQKVLKYYQNRKPESQDQSSEEVQNPKPTKKVQKSVSPKESPLVKPKSTKILGAVHEQPRGWMISQFAQPKRLEDLNEDEPEAPKEAEVDIPKKDKKSNKIVKKQTSSEQESESQQTPHPKKQKKQIKKQKKQTKTKGPVDTSYLNSEEEFELEDKKAKKPVISEKTKKKQELIQTRKKSADIQKAEPKPEVAKTTNQEFRNHDDQQYSNHQNGNGPKKFFSRIKEQEVGYIPENRRDNTFQAKTRYGAGDAWGQFGYEKLKETRGQSFKKTKGKLKNKAFQGSGININQINSVPII